MHPDDTKRLANLAITQAVLLLKRAVGGEPIVLLSELENDLWLFTEVPNDRPSVSFVVADGPRWKHKEYHKFKTLDEAMKLYEEVRVHGSWYDYHNKQLN